MCRGQITLSWPPFRLSFYSPFNPPSSKCLFSHFRLFFLLMCDALVIHHSHLWPQQQSIWYSKHGLRACLKALDLLIVLKSRTRQFSREFKSKPRSTECSKWHHQQLWPGEQDAQRGVCCYDWLCNLMHVDVLRQKTGEACPDMGKNMDTGRAGEGLWCGNRLYFALVLSRTAPGSKNNKQGHHACRQTAWESQIFWLKC